MLATPLGSPPRPDGAALAAVMARRRSIRRLRDGPFSPDALGRIVRAAQLVPSAYNRPPWPVVVIRARRAAFWSVVEVAFRERLSGDRLTRHLRRLDGFRAGAGAALIYEDRHAVAEMRAACNLDAALAQAYSEQGLGMVQLALWLGLVAEGFAASVQHWETLIEERVAGFLDLPSDRCRLVATMPLGYADEDPRPAERPAARDVISVDAYGGGELLGTI